MIQTDFKRVHKKDRLPTLIMILIVVLAGLEASGVEFAGLILFGFDFSIAFANGWWIRFVDSIRGSIRGFGL